MPNADPDGLADPLLAKKCTTRAKGDLLGAASSPGTEALMEVDAAQVSDTPEATQPFLRQNVLDLRFRSRL